MKRVFSALIYKTPKWYIGFCPEVPGANGQGKTKRECLDDLAAAVELMLEVNRDKILRQAPPTEPEEAVVTLG